MFYTRPHKHLCFKYVSCLNKSYYYYYYYYLENESDSLMVQTCENNIMSCLQHQTQTDRQIDRQTDRQTDRDKDKWFMSVLYVYVCIVLMRCIPSIPRTCP